MFSINITLHLLQCLSIILATTASVPVARVASGTGI